jgi:hypothetical protein
VPCPLPKRESKQAMAGYLDDQRIANVQENDTIYLQFFFVFSLILENFENGWLTVMIF